MAAIIESVEANSPAALSGLLPGDEITQINGEPLIDSIDYAYLTANRQIVVTFQRLGARRTLRIAKRPEEPLGLNFTQSLTIRTTCANRCVFCFVDQMPEGMRPSLYFKDDDWRLSLMMGNYITLTNISESNFNRIIKRHVSPLYISVHVTDPERRAEMMRNPNAAHIKEQLRKLYENGIEFHCQIVLCPGFNDGIYLSQTLQDLMALYPMARSVAVVPVGLTRYRSSLAPLAPVSRRDAVGALSIIQEKQRYMFKKYGTRFVFASDELYGLADMPVPAYEEYEDFEQIENGVGLLRRLEEDYTYWHDEARASAAKRTVAFVTGVAAYPFLRQMVGEEPFPGVHVKYIKVINRFFGELITVSGLLTGQDIAAALKDVRADEILLPASCLNAEGDLFLDDMTFSDMQAQIPIPIHVPASDGRALVEALLGQAIE
jgi:putative radical SAM enzyme (TIGR03279 family)